MDRVLIVDDNPENLYLLRALLDGHGFDVVEANNGIEALAKARHKAPDLVISDLLMPAMDGYTLLREWKADAALHDVPFIVYTATYAEAKDEQLGMELGADAFIIKPAEPGPFMASVKSILARTRSGGLAARPPLPLKEAVLKLHTEVLARKLGNKNAELEKRIAELEVAGQSIQRLNRLYMALSEANQAMVHISERQDLFREICRIAVHYGDFRLAWIGMLDAASGEIKPVSFEGAGYWLDRVMPFNVYGPWRAPVEISVGENRVYLCNDLASDARLAPIHSLLEEAGLASAISCPLRIDGQAIGALTLFSDEKDFFDAKLGNLIVEMAADVSFALGNLQKDAWRRVAEERLRASEEANRLSNRAIEASANGIMITCPRGGVRNALTYVNRAFERITGYARDEVLGLNPRFLAGADGSQIGLGEIHAALQESRETTAVLKNYRKDGSSFWNELSIAPVRDAAGAVTHFVGIINDITERKRYEEQLERQNNQDALTGLANRNLLHDRMERAMVFAQHAGHSVAMLFIDLDHFNRLNDSLGHAFGDSILRAIAGRIAGCLDIRDTLARLGGDEFVAVLPGMQDTQGVPLVADRILRAIEAPLLIDGREINVSASIGVSVYPDDGADYDMLLRNANAAMHRAKEVGRNTCRFYTASMNAQAMQKLELEGRLRRAVERNELFLHYQPLLSLSSGQVGDVEALLRWRGEDGKVIPPLDFIPLAEETGFIVPIGEWVLRTACRQVCAWQQAGIDLRVAVNLSARQFRDPNLADMVRGCLRDSGLSAHMLKLEITESAVMEDAEKAIDVLHELKALGVAISVDDFGTGYSSLAYLRRFPIDQLKVDRSFVQEVTQHPDSAAIVRSIIGLARSLRLQTVAEGVETEAQRNFLKEAGCDLLQGFFFSRPLPPEELLTLLQ